jgi:hypothetical protein
LPTAIQTVTKSEVYAAQVQVATDLELGYPNDDQANR